MSYDFDQLTAGQRERVRVAGAAKIILDAKLIEHQAACTLNSQASVLAARDAAHAALDAYLDAFEGCAAEDRKCGRMA